MKASILDLRRRMKDVLRALERNESVTVLYRGRRKAMLLPAREAGKRSQSAREHAAFGLWKDRTESDVPALVRRLREGRVHGL